MFNPRFIGILKHPGYNDPFSAAIAVGGSLLGSAISGSAAEDAAQTQADAANAANAQQLAIFNKQNAQQAPYRAAGYTSLNQIGSMLPGTYQQYDAQGNPTGTGTGSGYLTQQFTNQDLNANLAPNFAFQLGQGQQSLRNQQNATGGLIGGNALQGMQDYTQNFAGNAYQQAFNNFQGQRSNIYNTLAGIAGIGQTGQAATNQLAQNYGTNSANLMTGAAAAQAAGQVGAANAYSGGLQNAGNMYALSNLLGQGGGIGGGGGGAYTHSIFG